MFNYSTMIFKGGMYTPDDVCTAALGLILNPKVTFIRTNSISQVEKVKDVEEVLVCGFPGSKFDPNKGKTVLDHRFNMSELMYHEFYNDLRHIDDLDYERIANLLYMVSDVKQGNIDNFSLYNIIKLSLPNWNEDVSMDGAFINIAIRVSKLFKKEETFDDLVKYEMDRIVKKGFAKKEGYNYVTGLLKGDEEILVLDKYVPFEEALVGSKVQIVIHPVNDYDCWVAHLVPKHKLKAFSEPTIHYRKGYKGINKRCNISHWATKEDAYDAAKDIIKYFGR